MRPFFQSAIEPFCIRSLRAKSKTGHLARSDQSLITCCQLAVLRQSQLGYSLGDFHSSPTQNALSWAALIQLSTRSPA